MRCLATLGDVEEGATLRGAIVTQTRSFVHPAQIAGEGTAPRARDWAAAVPPTHHHIAQRAPTTISIDSVAQCLHLKSLALAASPVWLPRRGGIAQGVQPMSLVVSTCTHASSGLPVALRWNYQPMQQSRDHQSDERQPHSNSSR